MLVQRFSGIHVDVLLYLGPPRSLGLLQLADATTVHIIRWAQVEVGNAGASQVACLDHERPKKKIHFFVGCAEKRGSIAVRGLLLVVSLWRVHTLFPFAYCCGNAQYPQPSRLKGRTLKEDMESSSDLL